MKFRLSILTIALLILCQDVRGAHNATKGHLDSLTSNKPTNQRDNATPPGSFTSGFISTFSVIAISELGDKTFFIAALMAMKYPRRLVLAGALGALAVMHVGSCFFGYLFAFVPRIYILIASGAFFAFFGLKLLLEGLKMKSGDESEELAEVSQEIQKKEDQKSLESQESTMSKEGWMPFVQTFSMTFLAEWGDRSQISTIVLAAREDLTAVIWGGLAGHAICTGLAVIGGRFLSAKISVKTVTVLGGIVFLIFALSTLFYLDEKD